MKNIRKYWVDPNDGTCSTFIKDIKSVAGSTSYLRITPENQKEAFNVHKSEVIEVLTSTRGVLMEELILNPQFDKDYYLHHIGGVEFEYKGFTIVTFGEQSTFIRDERVFKNPQLLLEFEDELTFGDNAWIEIISKENLDLEFEVFGSVLEAKNEIDKGVLSARTRHEENN